MLWNRFIPLRLRRLSRSTARDPLPPRDTENEEMSSSFLPPSNASASTGPTARVRVGTSFCRCRGSGLRRSRAATTTTVLRILKSLGPVVLQVTLVCVVVASSLALLFHFEQDNNNSNSTSNSNSNSMSFEAVVAANNVSQVRWQLEQDRAKERRASAVAARRAKKNKESDAVHRSVEQEDYAYDDEDDNEYSNDENGADSGGNISHMNSNKEISVWRVLLLYMLLRYWLRALWNEDSDNTNTTPTTTSMTTNNVGPMATMSTSHHSNNNNNNSNNHRNRNTESSFVLPLYHHPPLESREDPFRHTNPITATTTGSRGNRPEQNRLLQEQLRQQHQVLQDFFRSGQQQQWEPIPPYNDDDDTTPFGSGLRSVVAPPLPPRRQEASGRVIDSLPLRMLGATDGLVAGHRHDAVMTAIHPSNQNRSDNPSNKRAAPSSCSICLELYQVGDNVRFLPGCDHVFHQFCIDSWLIVRAECPVCQHAIGGMESGTIRL